MARLLKLPEVAQRLEVSEKTARRYVKAGVLPSVFVGNAYRVNEEDVEEYLRRAKVEVAGNAPKAPGPTLQLEEQRGAGEERRFTSEVLGSYMSRRIGSLIAELNDKNSPHFMNSTAATNWVTGIRQEARDWADWTGDEAAVLMAQPSNREVYDVVIAPLLSLDAITRRAEKRIAAMENPPASVSRIGFEKASREAQESRRRFEELWAASG